MSNVLVVYFSRADENYYPTGYKSVKEGNTAKLATAIAQSCDCDIFAVQTDHQYPKAYRPCTEEAKKLLQSNFRPKLIADIAVAPYDVICVGYPMWWGTMPTDLMAFLEQHQAEFVGKKVLPFCTHEGSYFDHSINDLKKMLPGAEVLAGLEMFGHVAQDERQLSKQQTKIERFLAQI